MKIYEPKVEYWEQKDPIDHVARCAHVCYASVNKGHEANEKFFNNLLESNHTSMLRHGSAYFILPVEQGTMWIYELALEYKECPYISMNSEISDDGTVLAVYISTNAQFVFNNNTFLYAFEDYEVTPEEFKQKCPNLMRYTFCLTTQISTSRELNRVSPNNISEMSTRYIKFGGKVEPGIVSPWWFNNNPSDNIKTSYISACENAFKVYDTLLEELKPEEARGVLPLDTITKVVYTYTVEEWKHIIDLRYYGTTGKPHPNAKVIIGMVKNELNKLGYEL